MKQRIIPLGRPAHYLSYGRRACGMTSGEVTADPLKVDCLRCHSSLVLRVALREIREAKAKKV